MRVRLACGAEDAVGAVAHALAVAEGLAVRGHDVDLWAPAPLAGALPSRAPVPVRLVPLPGGPDAGARARAAAGALAAALAEEGGAEVVHAQDAVAAAALLEARPGRSRPALVRTVHHVEAHEDPALEEMERAAIQDVDACLCVSRFWAARIREEFGVHAVVVRNGVDLARIDACPLDRAEAGAALGWGTRPTVLALGGVSRRKGSRVLLEAFARARARLGTGALLAIAGAGAGPGAAFRAAWLEDAERLGLAVAQDGLAPDAPVALLGPVPADRLPLLYRASDVLAYPSTREGSAVAVLEAAAAGLPAAVSDLPVLREHLSADVDCLMVGPGDAGALAEALVRLGNDRALRARLLAGARAAAGGLRWADAVAAHERVYRSLAPTG